MFSEDVLCLQGADYRNGGAHQEMQQETAKRADSGAKFDIDQKKFSARYNVVGCHYVQALSAAKRHNQEVLVRRLDLS